MIAADIVLLAEELEPSAETVRLAELVLAHNGPPPGVRMTYVRERTIRGRSERVFTIEYS